MNIGYLYVTSNDVNDGVYVGQSSKLDDSSLTLYLGSGDYLRQAIDELGREHFTKRIVGYFDDQVELDYAETVLIAEMSANGIPLYNGGVGGPRAQKQFILSMLERFGVHPLMPEEWLEAVKSHPEEVREFLSEGASVDTDTFYLELESQLLITQDLSQECPRCAASIGEVCRTKTGKPARNHAGRRLR